MPDSLAPDQTLDLTAADRHNRIGDRFRAGWQAGNPPPIEDLLAEVPAPERPLLFAALLRSELHHRPPDPGAAAGYRARFPDYADLIDSLLRDPADTPPLPGPDPAPLRIEGYEVGGPLGSGGMGVVFRGLHVELDRPVAIKVVRDGGSGDPLARFAVEAKAVGSLGHPNVVTVYDYGRAADGRPFLVMELVEGGSLADRLNRAPADPRWAAGLVERLARAVQFVHDRGVIHRDLKPQNVLLAPDGTPKITDFGLAKRLDGSGPGLTATLAVLGTACYMSPEQARGDKDVGPPTDVWALGGILYECLTGRPPFHAGSYGLTIAQVVADDPARPTDLVPGLPADLEAICLKCLEKAPANRYASAAELAEDLGRFLDGRPTTARPLEPAEWHARWATRAGFELGERVAGTGATVTYRARQAAIDRNVWLKLATGPNSQDALRREAGALAGLHSPYVVRFHDYGERFAQPYLVLEDVEGGRPLTDRPADAGADVTPRRAAELGMMLTIGLQAVHEHGLIHGGLWTGAIVLSGDGVAKLANFGSARRADDPGRDLPFGVPQAFLAPEVRAGAWDLVGPAADLYALAAILHDLIHGEPPADSPRPTGEPELDAVLAHCLTPHPAARLPSAGRVGLALQLVLKKPAIGPSDSAGGSVTVVPGDSAPVPRPARYCLRVAAGRHLVGRTFVVPRSRLMIGRAPECHLHLPDKRHFVSREHCKVVWDPVAGCHLVVDIGRNGTAVNGEPVRERHRLDPGDRLGIADYVLVFEKLPDGGG